MFPIIILIVKADANLDYRFQLTLADNQHGEPQSGKKQTPPATLLQHPQTQRYCW